jgi:hypothetical protein
MKTHALTIKSKAKQPKNVRNCERSASTYFLAPLVPEVDYFYYLRVKCRPPKSFRWQVFSLHSTILLPKQDNLFVFNASHHKHPGIWLAHIPVAGPAALRRP